MTDEIKPKQKIYDQISYYFSDANLRKDKFLKEKIGEDADGWVPITVLLTFNRLKSMTEDAALVVEAITERTNDESTIELSEDKAKVRRVKPFVELTDEQLQELNERTVHFKGFPQDATLDDIKKFCSQFGSVESVEMRRFREDRKFKGCIMVIYTSKEEADKAVASTEVYSPDIKFQRETKVEYLKRKAEYFAQRNAKKAKKIEEEQDPVKVKSSVLLVSNISSELSFKDIKENMKSHGSVEYVEIDPEKKTATVRFSKENEAISVLKTASSKNSENEDENGNEIVINDATYQAAVLTGEDEIKYWRALNEFRRSNFNNNRGRKGRGFKRGGGGGYRGKRSGDSEGGSSAKKIKAESQ